MGCGGGQRETILGINYYMARFTFLTDKDVPLLL